MAKILIVDDLSENRYYLEVLLKSGGFEVVQASNGAEALELARADPPALIISDVLMPGMDGFSLCRACKTDAFLKEIPFIFYTATYTDARDESFARSLGAEAFLVKPIDPDLLLKEVRAALAKGAANLPPAAVEAVADDQVFYREYNEALIRKLEDKMLEQERANKRLASLYRISCEMHAMKPPGEIVSDILEHVIETAGYRRADYFEYDESRGELSLAAAAKIPAEIQAHYSERLVFRPGEKRGLVGLAAESGSSLNIADVGQNPDWIALDPGIQSALFTPVLYEKTLLGVLALFSEKTAGFSEADEHDIAILANSLAMMLENSRSHQLVKRQLKRVSALHNIDLVINSNIDLHTTLNIFLNNVIIELGVDAAAVLVSQPNRGEFEFFAGHGFNTLRIRDDRLRAGKTLDRKVARERRVVIVNELEDEEVSLEYAAVWKAENFKAYVGAPIIAKGQLLGVVEVYQREPFAPEAEWLQFLETLAGQAAIAIENHRMFSDLQVSNSELRMAYEATIEGWSRAMDLRDRETEGHTERVTGMTVQFAELMNVGQEQIVHIRRGALLHDIGKLGVPDSILFKPEPLSDEEWTVMRLHPQLAYDMLAQIDYLRPALDIPYCHHEKWDGSGYPRGLKGTQIPLAARMFSIIDVYDALCSDRPYRKAVSEEDTLNYIREQAGKYFEPALVGKFFELLTVRELGKQE